MAVARRSFGDIRENDPNIGNDIGNDDDAQLGGLLQGLFDPDMDQGGGLFDRSDVGAPPMAQAQPEQPPPASGGEGNRERPTEVFNPGTPRTPHGQMAIEDILPLLPRGVEAAGPSASDEAQGAGANTVPGLSPEPSPMAARHMPPAMPNGGEGMGGPMRNIPFSSPSALFAGGGQQGLGRVGGFSLPGQSQGGPQATKAMLELVRQLAGM